MRPFAVTAALLLLAGILAGCTGNGSDPDDVFTEAPRAGTGLIRGVVVDGAIAPVAEATVRLLNSDLATVTDAEGRFLLRDVEPGTHFIRVEKPGYTTTQQSVDVHAGLVNPPVLRVLIEVDPDSRPYVVELVFRGFIECSVRSPALGLNCGATENDKFLERYELESQPSHIQSELVWESTQTLSDHLAFLFSMPGSSTAYVRNEGPSPLLNVANGTVIKGQGLGPANDLVLRIFAASHPDTVPPCAAGLCLWGAGATVNQEFQAFTHVFYNMEPEEGWRFTEQGSPEGTV